MTWWENTLFSVILPWKLEVVFNITGWRVELCFLSWDVPLLCSCMTSLRCSCWMYSPCTWPDLSALGTLVSVLFSSRQEPYACHCHRHPINNWLYVIIMVIAPYEPSLAPSLSGFAVTGHIDGQRNSRIFVSEVLSDGLAFSEGMFTSLNFD